MPKKNDAKSISMRSLRECYASNGIYAGRKHFDDYWARDLFYSSWGAINIGDIDIVKKGLDLFLYDMKYNGQLPLRVGVNTFGQILKFFNLKWMTKKEPIYFQDKKGSYPQDQNSLFLITFEKYIEKTKDYDFLKEKYDVLKIIYYWNDKQTEDGLIKGGKYATWQDAVKKEGFTLYNNVLYYKSLLSMSNLADLAGRNNFYKERAKEVKKKINEKFWRKEYYVDWIDTKKNKYFSTDGNLFAILFDVANKEQSRKICKKMLSTDIMSPFGAKTNYPKYKPKETFMPYYLFNMQGYQNNDMHWLWLGCIAAMALKKAGFKKEAKDALEDITELIEEYGKVYEVYSSHGKPIKKLFYRAEEPFAWSSSFYILAQEDLK